MRSSGAARSQMSAGGVGGGSPRPARRRPAAARRRPRAAPAPRRATGRRPARRPRTRPRRRPRRARRLRGGRGRLGGRRLRRRGGRGPLGLALARGRLRPAGVQLAGEVLERHVDRQRQLVARLLARRRQAPLAVDQLEVAQERRVALALRLERVVVVPAGAAEVVQRAPEVEQRRPEVGRVRSVQAQPDRGAVVDRVGHVALAQQPPQPLGLGGRDVERLGARRPRARSACPCRSARPSRGPR